MKLTPRPFQLIGAQNLANNYRHFLADDMGLGKTIQALLACEMRDFKRVAVAAPASVRPDWKQRIVDCGLEPSRFHVDSYNAVSDGKFPAGPYDCLILDEAQYLKNLESQRTQAIFGNAGGLARNCKFIWPMSGSWFMNRTAELYPVLKACAADRIKPYDTWDKFTRQYCGAYWEGPGRGMNTRGASNLEDLSKRMNGFITRRLAKDVMPEMPLANIMRPVIELSEAELRPILELESEISNREMYLSPTSENFSQLGDTSRMRKVLGMAKAPKIAQFVDDLIDSGSGKVVVFYKHTDVARYLDGALGHHLPVTFKGGMTDESKTKTKLEFMDKKSGCEVFLGQIQAAGTGLDGLQKASWTIVFAEQEWSPEEIWQNIKRLCRMGMDFSRPVNAYMPHVPGTLESAMMQVQLAKERVKDAVYEHCATAFPVCAFPVCASTLDLSQESRDLLVGLI